MLTLSDCIVPDWPAPKNVRSVFTTRIGGVSLGALAGLNLGKSVGDDPLAVAENRRRVEQLIGFPPRWMSQVHGVSVADLDAIDALQAITADSAFSRQSGRVCTAMVADCLPVLFTDLGGTVVAAVHAGWRGLAAGVIEATIQSMHVAPANLLAWMGPAIGPEKFEVGIDVRDTFVALDTATSCAFHPIVGSHHQKFLADIFKLARLRLSAAGIAETHIYGGGLCTVSDPERFFSHRREGKSGLPSGRMAAFIHLA